MKKTFTKAILLTAVMLMTISYTWARPSRRQKAARSTLTGVPAAFFVITQQQNNVFRWPSGSDTSLLTHTNH